jgi:hypothetical protein
MLEGSQNRYPALKSEINVEMWQYEPGRNISAKEGDRNYKEPLRRDQPWESARRN